MSRHPLNLLALVVVSACEPAPERVPADIPNRALSGVVGGSDWAYQIGLSDPTVSSDDEWFVHLTDDDIDCDRIDGGDELLMRVPTLEGEWELEGDDLVFYVQATAERLEVEEGTLRIDVVTNDHIEGALMARANDDNDVAGTFTVLRCSGL